MPSNHTPGRDSAAEARAEAVRLYLLASRNRRYYQATFQQDLMRHDIAGLIDRGLLAVVFALDPTGPPVRVLPKSALRFWRLACCRRRAGDPEVGVLLYCIASELSCWPCAAALGIPAWTTDPEQPRIEYFLSATVAKGGLHRPPGGWQDLLDRPS